LLVGRRRDRVDGDWVSFFAVGNVWDEAIRERNEKNTYYAILKKRTGIGM
jgi:hypothetical protein